MFVPSDGIYQAALGQDPALIEYGVQQQVLMATPTTLIGLLWAVHYGWRQELIAESAREIAESARELHRRLGRFVEPLAKIGRQLDSAVSSYNEAVGSFERRVIPQVRRIEQAGAALRARGRAPGDHRDQRPPDHRAAGVRAGPDAGDGEASGRVGSAQSADAGASPSPRRIPAGASSTTMISVKRHRHCGRQLVDEEEQQVEAQRQQRRERRAAQLPRAPHGDREQRAEHGRDEQVAVAHHRRAEHRALQPRQAGRRVCGVQRVVRPLQQIRDDERVSATAIATIPAASQRGGVTAASSTPSVTQLSADSTSAAASPARPPRSAQASANSGATSSARAGRGGWAFQASQPSASAASSGHRDQRQIGETLRARLFGCACDEHEADHRQRRDHRPAAAAQPSERTEAAQCPGPPPGRPGRARARRSRSRRGASPINIDL